MATKLSDLAKIQLSVEQLKVQFSHLQALKEGKNVDVKIGINNELIVLYERIVRHNNRIMQLGGIPTDAVNIVSNTVVNNSVMIANLILGDGEPRNSLGQNGEIYLDNLTGNYYHKKKRCLVDLVF